MDSPEQALMIALRTQEKPRVMAFRAALSDEGYVVVPREPTEGMVEAMKHYNVRWAAAIYRAALAAYAPKGNDD